MSLNPTALTTVANVQAVVGSSYYAVGLIQLRINQISETVYSICSRDFIYQVIPATNPESYKGTGTVLLAMRNRPILNISSVLIDGAAYSDWQRDAVRDDGGLLFRLNIWRRSAARYNDVTQDADNNLLAYNVQVSGTYGYLLPQYLQAATLSSNIHVTGLTDTTNLAVGMFVLGNGIPAGATIATIVSSTAIDLSAAATISGTSNLSFYAAGDNTQAYAAKNLPSDLEGAVIDEVVKKLIQPLPGIEQQKTPGGEYTKWYQHGMIFAPENMQIFLRYAEKYPTT